MQDLTHIVEKVKSIAKEAGAFIRKERQNFNLDKVEQKGLNDLVSYVDKQAEMIIVSRLQQVLPEADFIAEEGSAGTSGKDWTWIIDPLDGTTNFIHGVPVFSVSIGLRHLDEIVLGVVYEINQDECFSAVKGHGAFCNEKPIKVSPSKCLSEGLMATGFPYSAFKQLDQYLAVLKALMETCHGVRRMGSAAVDLCYVAAGRFDAFYEYDLKPYDVAAGSLIVQEAGGTVTDFKGGKDYLFGKEILASTPLVYREIQDILSTHWKS
ncbi:inositol monophosphatase family protein [Mongoliitalea lutea]|uniref:Inositol-1-monophosphatase n=1 Tax=Mongoliitalea lutea TaxID=849756 RepID=A0A8J3CYF5_9BACT|nr:inositol monophosphatase family protein [Mongoliitalea lutea]GHB37614.1 inositol monophosphatase [Mongoliitalea lutea]